VRLILIIALALTSCTGSLAFGADGQLNPAIGPPKVALYRSIRDGRDWRNPVLAVQDDGVLISANGAKNPTHVAIEDVKAFLISLPVSAWPYGRVVVQSNQHILPVPWEDYVRNMSKIEQQVGVLLKDLKISVEFWQ